MRAERLPLNPIITQELLRRAGDHATNICGPSLIRVPSWIAQPLGKYYLYFADHSGAHIKLAYAEQLTGPWRVHPPGTLQLAQAPDCHGHIASPDVQVDEINRQIRLYFHGPSHSEGSQRSYLALSTDGLHFSACRYPIADFYLRTVSYQNHWLAMSKGGAMYRSQDGISGFERLPCEVFPLFDRHANSPGSVRHVALMRRHDQLQIYFSRIGDAPESILRAQLNLALADTELRASEPELLLQPETEWEGVNLPITRSSFGPAKQPQHALRDPCLFSEAGQDYLLYSTAGEQAIAIAKLVD